MLTSRALFRLECFSGGVFGFALQASEASRTGSSLPGAEDSFREAGTLRGVLGGRVGRGGRGVRGIGVERASGMRRGREVVRERMRRSRGAGSGSRIGAGVIAAGVTCARRR